jgi:hypothetical protein
MLLARVSLVEYEINEKTHTVAQSKSAPKFTERFNDENYCKPHVILIEDNREGAIAILRNRIWSDIQNVCDDVPPEVLFLLQ